MGHLAIPVIDAFRGDFFFLSNFSPATTPYIGRLLPTSEHAYAMAKTDDPAARAAISQSPTPAEAKQIGQSAPVVAGWPKARFAVMEKIVAAKFDYNAELAV
jgi:predicted NAD-dependent protein-ADP-ribosyltransferase YbiA (DUF1768 family)